MADPKRSPEPASHPQFVETLTLAVDGLLAWRRRNGCLGANAPINARIWEQLLDQSHRLGKHDTAPAILKQDLGAPLGIRITKEKWMSFLSWWNREIRDDYIRACQLLQVPILYPARTCDSKGGYSESKAAIYFLSLLEDGLSATERSAKIPDGPTSVPPVVDKDSHDCRPFAKAKERRTADTERKVKEQRPNNASSKDSGYRPIALPLHSPMNGSGCSANTSVAIMALMMSILLMIFFFQLEYTILSLWTWLAEQLGAISGLFKFGIFATL